MKPGIESNMSSPVVIGIDIGKEVFHLVGFTADGKIAFRRRIKRLALKDVFEKLRWKGEIHPTRARRNSREPRNPLSIP